jgi:hypothetical protein
MGIVGLGRSRKESRERSVEVKVGNIIWSQIPIGVKMSLGMRDGEVKDNSLEVRVGPMRPARKVKITLNGSDLYDIELVKMKKGKEGFVSWQREDSYDSLYADQLGEVLLWMESKNWG